LEEAVLALDFGGTQLRTAVAHGDGTLSGRRASRTPRTADDIVQAAVGQLGQTLAHADVGRGRPRVLAISAPGPLDPYAGMLLTPPNLDRSLWDFPLAKQVGDEIGLPAVMERDTQIAVLAETEFGAAIGERDCVYVTVSTGIGGGVIADGRLLRGADGLAGELGHLTIDYNGPLCGCGMPGHVEALASGTGIARAARAAGLGEADAGEIDARRVAELEDQGNGDAHQIMEDARRAFAAAVVTMVNVFNPSVIVVGGGIAIAQGDRLLAPARAALRESGYSRQAERVRIVPAGLGDDVGLIGGLSLVRLARLGDHVSSGLSDSGRPGPG
jgi:glucokinase